MSSSSDRRVTKKRQPARPPDRMLEGLSAPAGWKRRIRRARFALSTVFAIGVIGLAVLVGLTQLALPWLVRNPERVEAWLSTRLGRSVSVGHVGGGWIGGGPEITLDDVHVGPGGGGATPLVIPHAQLAIDFLAPFERNRAWNEFRLIGLDLELDHTADGAWHMRGLDAGGVPRQSMGALGALVLKDLRLKVRDARNGWQVGLGASELRVLNRGSVTRVLGKLSAIGDASAAFDLVADIDFAGRSGTMYLGGRDIDLTHLPQLPVAAVTARAGRGDIEFWATWSRNRINDARTRIGLRGATFGSDVPIAIDTHTSVAPRAHLDALSFVARWRREATGWDFDLADLVSGPSSSGARGSLSLHWIDEGHPHFSADARDLALQPLGSLAMLSDRLPVAVRHWLYLSNPAGQLSHVAVQGAGRADYSFDADIAEFRCNASGSIPGFELAAATLHGDNEATMLSLPPKSFSLVWPRVFRKSLRFSQFGGDLVLFRSADDDAWRVATDSIAFEGEGYGGSLGGTVDIQDDASRPLLDVYANVAHADVTAGKLFWPINVMPPPAVEWLDRALIEGAVSDGRAELRGDLDDWPFDNNAGRFEAHARIDDMTLAYHPEWPRATQVGLTADFVNVGLHASVDHADSMGIQVASAEASIADLGETVLDLSAKASGTGADLLTFLHATPIGKDHADALKGLAIGGNGAVALQLHLPVKDLDNTTLDGTVDLRDAALDENRYDVHLTHATGPVDFNKSGFVAGPLSASLDDHPVSLHVAAGAHVDGRAHDFEAGLDGHLPATVVFARVPALAPALAHFPGASDWHVALTIDQDPAGPPRSNLDLRSDLVGTTIALPAPLDKPADAALPFELDLDLPYEGARFTARLGDRLAVQGRLPAPDKTLGARLQFGAAAAEAPPAAGVDVGGQAGVVDLGGWLGLAGGPGESGAEMLDKIDLGIDDLVVSKRHFGQARLVVDASKAGNEIAFSGANIDGTLKLPAGGVGAQDITADFRRLHWPDAAPSDDAAIPPGSNALSGIAPGSLPALHFSIGDFTLGSASFGSAHFDSRPVADGMHIERLDTKSPNVTMKASGDWTGSADNNRSHLVIELGAQNLGHMLDALGFSGLIDGGPTEATIDAVWPGAPSAFALADLTGSLKVKVGEGRILDVHPGAGRLFGLLSLREIPRRLSLDFSDFFKSGLGFNSITGTFRLADGNAYTDDLAIKSPAAEIQISGRTGLRAKDYDQQMVVTPHAGATLPVVGAIAGGPVGAAAGLVIQSLLSKPIGAATQSRYHVGGTWEKPVITSVGKHQDKPAKAEEPEKDKSGETRDSSGQFER